MKLSRQRTPAKGLGALALGCAGFALLAALTSGAVPARTVATVEVPVRVFDGDRFVDDLSLSNFKVFEDGVAVQPDSLYLVKGRSIVRRVEDEPAQPDTMRTYYLMFQTVDWDPKLSGAIDELFSSVLKPGDAMTLVTPMKPYALNKDALATQPPAKLSKSMQEILKKDIQQGGGQYRDMVRELTRLTRSIGGVNTGAANDIEGQGDDESTLGFGVEQQIDHYRNALMTIESLRLVDEKKLLAFAGALKPVPGRKTVFLFYAREYRPELSPMAMQTLMSLYQDNPSVLGNLMDLFQFYKREANFNADRVKKAFADAGIAFHFIFMEKKSQRVFGATMREQSEDIFPGFRDIAAATGGITEVSENPAASFAKAAAVSEDYYLLYYTPPAAHTEPGFRTIEVKVATTGGEGARYTINNRLGYFAR